jgi:hypothetical protein
MLKGSLFLSVLFLFSGFNLVQDQPLQEQVLTECVKKYNAEWGRTCSACKQEMNTYTVFLRNDCNHVVDIKCAVQEAEKRWRTFTRLSVAPKDTMLAYACHGTGKYLYWVRKSNDKTVVFPTDEEINNTYSK